jgi:hypothetical protein
MDHKTEKTFIESVVKGNETSLINSYIEKGPAALIQELSVSQQEWDVVFDYLVFNHNLLYKVVVNNTDFFLEGYIENGFAHTRKILNVEAEKYDMVCKLIFDFIAISNGGLRLHVIEHKDKYMDALKEHGGDFVRKVLYIWDKKYEKYWEEILDSLLSDFCFNIFTEQTLEKGISLFTGLVNMKRQHRLPVPSKLFKRGLV